MNETTIQKLNAKKQLLEHLEEVSKVKKTDRINLWVTKEFYEDVKRLLPAFSGNSLSEMVVELATETLNEIKQHEIWQELLEFEKAKNKWRGSNEQV